MDDHFRIGIRGKAMSVRFESLSQRLKIVDLAIEDHPGGSIFVAQRLMACVQIDDAQSPHS
jgi:hypothetical protein